MTKRTRKEKVGARHPFLISWEKTESVSESTPVKGQMKIEAKSPQKKINTLKNADIQDKELSLDQMKHNIVRSLLLASLILGLELVIYFVWRKPSL